MTVSSKSMSPPKVISPMPAWGKPVLSHFTNDMTSIESPFPCILGVEGLKKGHIRFAFIENHNEKGEIRKLSEYLKLYLRNARHFGKYTSLVVFFKPSYPLLSVENYEKQFWHVLQNLNKCDEQPWPEAIPHSPEESRWEFSFHGEPMFVVCNTPVHKKRKSRYSSTFMMTFQPRWVFEGLNGETKKGKHVKQAVRKRLKNYDEIDAHPLLAWYGAEDVLEWKQYFLRDNNREQLTKCPFYTEEKKT